MRPGPCRAAHLVHKSPEITCICLHADMALTSLRAVYFSCLAICVLGDFPMGACPCSGGLARTLRQDLDRYLFQLSTDVSLKPLRLLRILIEVPGIWAVVPYRLTHQCLYRMRPKRLATT